MILGTCDSLKESWLLDLVDIDRILRKLQLLSRAGSTTISDDDSIDAPAAFPSCSSSSMTIGIFDSLEESRLLDLVDIDRILRKLLLLPRAGSTTNSDDDSVDVPTAFSSCSSSSMTIGTPMNDNSHLSFASLNLTPV